MNKIIFSMLKYLFFSLKDKNIEIADQMLVLVNETEKREGQIERMQMEFQLQIKLLEHQVQQ